GSSSGQPSSSRYPLSSSAPSGHGSTASTTPSPSTSLGAVDRTVGWQVGLTVGWRPERGPTDIDGIALATPSDAEALLDPATWHLEAARTGRSAARYRAELAETVTRLIHTRRQLAGVPPDEGSLRDRVDRRLWLAELDARLDVLTGAPLSVPSSPDLRGDR
ncbi:MAG: hypothetical protein ABMB14_03010, partial [Myxococcota bacterium]